MSDSQKFFTLYTQNHHKLAHLLHQKYHKFKEDGTSSRCYIIGITGGVATGKTVLTHILKNLIAQWQNKPCAICASYRPATGLRVQSICTDSFLFSNHELSKRGLENRKGFPESYDNNAMLTFFMHILSNQPCSIPVYSHDLYDIIPEAKHFVPSIEILLVEGLSILNFKRMHPDKKIFDTIIYIDAAEDDNKRWFINRFLTLRARAQKNMDSFYQRFINMNKATAIKHALYFWEHINTLNLHKNILPFKKYADIIIKKASDHTINYTDKSLPKSNDNAK